MSRTSVLIVGAGLLGCATAYYLARRGVDVTVLDAESIGGQASGLTAGNIHLQLSYRAMKGTEEQFVHHTRVLELTLDAARRWDALGQELGIPVVRRGGVVVAESQSDLELLARKVELENAAGFGTEFLDREALHAAVPELSAAVIGGSFHAGEGHVHFEGACAALSAAAVAHGARFVTDSPVTALDKLSSGWRTESTSGTYLADSVVVCAGSWTDRVLALADAVVPMERAGLTVALTEPAEPFLRTLVMHASRPLSIKQTVSGGIMIGGGRPATLREAPTALGLVAEPTPSSVAAGLDDLGRVIARAGRLPLQRSWQGTLGTPGDELPVIGELPGRLGLFVAVAGHTGYTLGPTCAWLVSQAVLGDTPDVTGFGPERFEK